jgi:hypothetical protein
MDGDLLASARRWLRFQQQRSAAVLRRQPWQLRRGVRAVTIASLVSPLRYDIVVRKNFLAELGARIDAPPDEQVAWARGTDYWRWFRDARWLRASERFKAGFPDIDAAFRARVRAAAALRASFASRGFDPRNPIVLKSAERALPTSTGKRAETQLFAGGGCHRIALLWLSGAEEIRADQYVSRHYPEWAPHDNTHLLRELFVSREAEYARFIASAYTREPIETIEELLAWVRRQAPDRLENLTMILRVDGILRPLSDFVEPARR